MTFYEIFDANVYSEDILRDVITCFPLREGWNGSRPQKPSDIWGSATLALWTQPNLDVSGKIAPALQGRRVGLLIYI